MICICSKLMETSLIYKLTKRLATQYRLIPAMVLYVYTKRKIQALENIKLNHTIHSSILRILKLNYLIISYQYILWSLLTVQGIWRATIWYLRLEYCTYWRCRTYSQPLKSVRIQIPAIISLSYTQNYDMKRIVLLQYCINCISKLELPVLLALQMNQNS